MNIRAVSSAKPTAVQVAEDIKSQLGDFEVKMMVFFASWETYNPKEIGAQMQAAFPQGSVFGCSSHAEINDTKTLKGSVTAMAFNSEAISDVKIEILQNISKGIDVQHAFDSFDAHFKTPMADADYKTYGGIVLVDGLSLKEEDVMDKIGSKTNIMFTGGSASDALKFESTYIYANGQAYTDAALLAVFKAKNGISFIKTQSVDNTGIELKITKADTAKRAIIEFDNKSAVARYAEALGVSVDGVENSFFANPVGLVIGSDVYIRSCQRREGEVLYLYCNVLEGTTLNLLKIKDIIPDTKLAVEDKLKELGKISAILDFRCVLRTLQLENEGKTDKYGEIFKGIPTVGFSTYGEEFLGHINQTSTMIVFE